MPRSTNMISHIGAAAAAAASSSHSPTSTTTPTKPPPSDPYAYHEETETDLPTSHTTPSSNTPSRTHVYKHNVSHKMGDSHPRLKMVFNKNQRGAGGSVHSPKRGGGSHSHHDEPKKQKLFGGGLYGDKQHHSSVGDKPKSKYSVFDSHVGSSLNVHSPASDSSQDSDLYDPKLNTGDSTSKVAKLDQHSHSNVSSSDSNNKSDTPSSAKSNKKDSEASAKVFKKEGETSVQKSYKRDSEAVPKNAKKEADAGSKPTSKELEPFVLKSVQKESIADTSFQPDSQMPILSQDGFSPVQFDMNIVDDVSDSDENPLQIDVDSTTTPTKPDERSSTKQNIPTSLFHGAFKSDVSSSSISVEQSSKDVKQQVRQSPPQSTDSTSPYHFTDSPCSTVTPRSYKHTERTPPPPQHDANSSSSSSSFPSFTNFAKSSDKVAEKYGSKGNNYNSKGDKMKQKESHQIYSTGDSVRQFGVVSQSDTGGKREGTSTDSTQKALTGSGGASKSHTVSSSSTVSKTSPTTTATGYNKTVTSPSSVTGNKAVSSSITSGKPSVTANNNRPAVITSSTNNSSTVAKSDDGGHGKLDKHSPKADTTTDIKPVIKVEVKEEHHAPVISSCGGISSTEYPSLSDSQKPQQISIKEEKVDVKPVIPICGVKIEKTAVKLEKDAERSKSPRLDNKEGGGSRRNSPKLYEGSRSSPRPFPFKDSALSGVKNGGSTPKWDTNRSVSSYF